MPTVNVNGAGYYFEDKGGDGEVVVMSPGLLIDRQMFDFSAAELSRQFRCVTFDWRGQGRSETTRSGYEMDSLASDAATIITTLGLAPCHFVGVSMGGFAGLRLAIRRPELLRSLVLMSSPAEAWPLGTAAKVLILGLVGRVFGYRSIVGPVMSNFFGASFNRDPEREEERRFWRAKVSGVDRVGAFRTVRALVFRHGVASELNRISTPTLVISGEEDTAFPPDQARLLASQIPNAKFVTIAHAGHYGIIDQPTDVTQAIASFLVGCGVPSTG